MNWMRRPYDVNEKVDSNSKGLDKIPQNYLCEICRVTLFIGVGYNKMKRQLTLPCNNYNTLKIN